MPVILDERHRHQWLRPDITKDEMVALELTDKDTAYLTLVEKTLSEIYGLELFLSPLLENEEGYIIEPLQ